MFQTTVFTRISPNLLFIIQLVQFFKLYKGGGRDDEIILSLDRMCEELTCEMTFQF